MPTLRDPQADRDRRLRRFFSRAASALVLAFLASSGLAPGFGPTRAQPIAPDAVTMRRSARLIAQATISPATQVVESTNTNDRADGVPLSAPTIGGPAPGATVAAVVASGADAAAEPATEELAAVVESQHARGQTGPSVTAAVSHEEALAFLAQLDVSATEVTLSGGDAEPPAAPAYEDQYLVADGRMDAGDLAGAPAARPFGQQTLSTEMIYYRADDDLFGEDLERGARVFWSRETENWGTFDVDLLAASVYSSYGTRQIDGTEAVVTLRQNLMPISESATLDAVAGHQRPRMSPLLRGGYRMRLPTSIMFGASGEITGIDRHWRFASGTTGKYRGFRIPRFDDTGGRLTQLGYDQRVNDRFEVGAELANVSDDDDIRDHTSMLLSTRYTTPGGVQRHSGHLLADDDGNLAFWTDSRHELEFGPTLRYGLFRFDRDVVWADRPIARGQSGLYFRADAIRSVRYNVSVGYDYLKSDLGSDFSSARDAHSVFFAGSLRVLRSLTLGLNTYVTTRSIEGVNEDDQINDRVTVFALVQTDLGDARIEAFTSALDSDVPASERDLRGYGATFNWRMPERVRLTTQLRTETANDLRGATERAELSALFRYDLFDNVSLGINSALYRTSGSRYSEEDGLSLSIDARWDFLPNWSASLTANHSSAEYQVTDPNLFPPSGVAGRSGIWLTVRYERRSGQPYPRFGRTHDGMSGSGSISGQIFLDANRDGLRQPSESAATGVVVRLDGRYETRTDAQGRYSFEPVPTGAHQISIVTEELPLPWGLDDETPRRVVVRFHQDSSLILGLTEMQ